MHLFIALLRTQEDFSLIVRTLYFSCLFQGQEPTLFVLYLCVYYSWLILKL